MRGGAPVLHAAVRGDSNVVLRACGATPQPSLLPPVRGVGVRPPSLVPPPASGRWRRCGGGVVLCPLRCRAPSPGAKARAHRVAPSRVVTLHRPCGAAQAR